MNYLLSIIIDGMQGLMRGSPHHDDDEIPQKK